jgi:hypothetical protein
MLPRDLSAEKFSAYPPQARRLAADHVDTFRKLPLSFLPSMLRELIDYDFKFPAERAALEKEVANLSSLTPDQAREWLQEFASIELSSKLESVDWVNSPAQFVEQLSSHLWTTHQLDAFRLAATHYSDRLMGVAPPQPPVVPRLGIAVIGQGVESYEEPLFRKLRPCGVYFPRVKAAEGMKQLLDVVSARAKNTPQAYGHWYIDGGPSLPHDPLVTTVSYAELEPVRAALLRKMRAEIDHPGMGPEMLRTIMARLRPGELGMEKGDETLNRFQVKLLTEGSGTQIFSTSFTQWAAREVLRRAQPLTLLVRFAPRQRQRPMNEMLALTADRMELDLPGSLVDADMGAYYNWLNQQRLTGADKSAFIAWFENHGAAVAIGPGLARGTESSSEPDFNQLITWFS